MPLLPFGAASAVESTGWGLFWWLGPLWVFVVIPLVDALLPEDRSNPPEWAVPALEADRYYRWCTYLFLPIQLAGFVYGAWLWSTLDLGLLDRLGLALTVGTVSGIGIANAHELGHKKEAVERWLSKVVLAQSGYGHFYVEHNRGHHTGWPPRRTRPAPAWVSASGRSCPAPWSAACARGGSWSRPGCATRAALCGRWRNDVLNAWAMTVVLFAALIAWPSVPAVVPFLVIQAVFGFSLLEVVNYVEHYGLLRQRTDTGRYERCRPDPLAGTATTSPPTCSSTTWSVTPITTPTRPAATSRCGTSTTRPSCPTATGS